MCVCWWHMIMLMTVVSHVRQWSQSCYLESRHWLLMLAGVNSVNMNGCRGYCGRPVNWVTSARYLGVYLERSFTFKCSLDVNKAKFYQITVYLKKIRRIASEEVLFALIKSKCLPILLYGTEAYPINSAMRHSLQFALNIAFFKYLVLCLMTRTKIYVNTSA